MKRTSFILILLSIASFYQCQTTGSSASSGTKYKLSAFKPASPTFPGATLADMEYKNGSFNYVVQNYQLGEQTPDAPTKMCANSKEGQHIHLIVDNEPYIAKYTASFAQEVKDGSHYILSFLSRSYHESIKMPEAKIAKKVTVKNKNITEESDITSPMLFYSRPKGTYVGKAETTKVMLDFYLLNATLSKKGYKVKADINGEIHLLNSWEPMYIEGLPLGDNTITLTLLDVSGNIVDAPLNPVSRTFTLKADPAEN